MNELDIMKKILHKVIETVEMLREKVRMTSKLREKQMEWRVLLDGLRKKGMRNEQRGRDGGREEGRKGGRA